jgi:polyhydroxyalkanoate synthesis repressor PhaR
MPRQIKRYGSRKLYDSVASRYVSMQAVAEMIREGQEVEIVDNETGEDVTVQVLTQVISEQGRRGSSFPSGLLHDLIRVGEEALQAGEDAMTNGVKQLQQNVEGFVQRTTRDALGKLTKPSPMQQEMEALRRRLNALEASLDRFDEDTTEPSDHT